MHQEKVKPFVQNSEVRKNQSGFGRKKRVKKLSSKGTEYQFPLVKSKSEKLYSNLLMESNAIEDLLYSRKKFKAAIKK